MSNPRNNIWTRALTCLLVPPMLLLAWLSHLVTAVTAYLLYHAMQPLAHARRMQQRIRSISHLHRAASSASSFSCSNHGAHATEKKKGAAAAAAAASPSAHVPSPTRRSLASCVGAWDAARKTCSSSPSSSPRTPPPTPDIKLQNRLSMTSIASDDSATSDNSFRITPSSPSPSPFPPPVQTYLHRRLPVHRPPTPETVSLHFARLPFVYRALADGCRAQAFTTPPGPARDRRRRMCVLAARLAERHRAGARVVLPEGVVRGVLAKHADVGRASRFWEAVLDEIESANAAWSVTRAWVVLSLAQSVLALLVCRLLPPSMHVGVILANAAVCVWSASAQWREVRARLVAAKTDEQELHDLMGGM